jgi:hypothetical protein
MPSRVRLEAAAVLVVLVLGAYLRLRYTGAHGFWLDEHATLWAARGATVSGVISRARDVNGSPPYYLLVRATIALLGETESTVRLPTAIAGALLPLLAYVALRRPLGARAGGAALLLFALHPLLVDQSQTARAYPFAELGTLLAIVGLGRAVDSGRLRDRALTWLGAIVAVHAHYVSLTVFPLVLLTAAVARSRAYPLRAAAGDGLLAVLGLLPVLGHMASLFHRRREQAWVDQLAPAGTLGELIPHEVRIVLGLALVVGAWSFLGRRLGRSAAARATVAYALLGVALPIGLLLGLYVLGANIFTLRYLGVALVAVLLLTAAAVSVLPRPAGALALVVLAWMWGQRQPGNFGQEWREASAQLTALAPAKDEPILLWPCFVEANLVVEPGGLTGERRSFLASTMEVQPGRPEPDRDYVLLPARWLVPGQPGYFERAVVPPLERAHRFYLVAHPDYRRLFEGWLTKRFPGQFRSSFASREFVGPTVVVRYDRLPP